MISYSGNSTIGGFNNQTINTFRFNHADLNAVQPETNVNFSKPLYWPVSHKKFAFSYNGCDIDSMSAPPKRAASINELFGQLTDKNGFGSMPFTSWAKQVYNICYTLQDGGETDNRPEGNKAVIYLYRPFFDTTLGKPIWLRSVSPNVWVDANGTVV